MRKKRKKQKRRKQNPKGEPRFLAWRLNGCACTSLCVYPCPQWVVAQPEGLEEKRGSLDGFVTEEVCTCRTARLIKRTESRALGEKGLKIQCLCSVTCYGF